MGSRHPGVPKAAQFIKSPLGAILGSAMCLLKQDSFSLSLPYLMITGRKETTKVSKGTLMEAKGRLFSRHNTEGAAELLMPKGSLVGVPRQTSLYQTTLSRVFMPLFPC